MNNLGGEPTQDKRPSIFTYETYPPQIGPPIDWSRIPVQQVHGTMPAPPVNHFNPIINYQQQAQALSNFSFCTTDTPYLAQFPFPTPPPPPPTQTIQANSQSEDGFGFHPITGQQPLRCKRKTDSPPPIPPQYKQHITEEKMAEHMSRLHINSEMAQSSKESDADRTKRLYMCEEMRKLQNDSILPQSLLHRLQQPCTALVLWQPPRSILNLEDANNNQGANNNEESVPDDNNVMENEEPPVVIGGNTMDLDSV